MTYGWHTTTDELLEARDLTGMRAVITGASAGLGAETVLALATHGASVVMAVRDLEKGERAADAARAAAPNAPVQLVELDLASLASVHACANRLLADGRAINVLIANAGIMGCQQGATADGFEKQFGTNHLGHFVFVNRLVPLLVAGAPARVVILSSAGHRFSDIDLDDPNFERTPYDPWSAYGRSKTANVLFAAALDWRLRSRSVRACAVHPGHVPTELGRSVDQEARTLLAQRRAVNAAPRFKSITQGAATTVWAALVANGELVGGRYCEDCAVAEATTDASSQSGVRPYAVDAARAEALWSLSEELVSEHFSV